MNDVNILEEYEELLSIYHELRGEASSGDTESRFAMSEAGLGHLRAAIKDVKDAAKASKVSFAAIQMASKYSNTSY